MFGWLRKRPQSLSSFARSTNISSSLELGQYVFLSYDYKVKNYESAHKKGAWLTASIGGSVINTDFFISPNQEKTTAIPLNKLMSVLF